MPSLNSSITSPFSAWSSETCSCKDCSIAIVEDWAYRSNQGRRTTFIAVHGAHVTYSPVLNQAIRCLVMGDTTYETAVKAVGHAYRCYEVVTLESALRHAAALISGRGLKANPTPEDIKSFQDTNKGIARYGAHNRALAYISLNWYQASHAFAAVADEVRQALLEQDESERIQKAMKKYTDPEADNPRLMGLEVEFNNQVDLEDWRDAWPGSDVHEDGSCGWEAVTPPANGKFMRRCVFQLSEALVGAGCNERCGLHVHVDARDFDWGDMLRLAKVYSLVEPALYIIGGQQRTGNNYAAPIGAFLEKALQASTDAAKRRKLVDAILHGSDPSGDTEWLDGIVKGTNTVDKKANGRYKGLNMVPWLAGRKHKSPVTGKETVAPDCTVEFRLHRGTHSPTRLIAWAQLCADIVQYAATHSDKEIAELPKSAFRAIMIMSPKSSEWLMSRLKGWRRATTVQRSRVRGIMGHVKAPRRVRLVPGKGYRIAS